MKKRRLQTNTGIRQGKKQKLSHESKTYSDCRTEVSLPVQANDTDNIGSEGAQSTDITVDVKPVLSTSNIKTVTPREAVEKNLIDALCCECQKRKQAMIEQYQLLPDDKKTNTLFHSNDFKRCDFKLLAEFPELQNSQLDPRFNTYPTDFEAVRPISFQKIEQQLGNMSALDKAVYHFIYQCLLENFQSRQRMRENLHKVFSELSNKSFMVDSKTVCALYASDKSSQLMCVEWMRFAAKYKSIRLPKTFLQFHWDDDFPDALEAFSGVETLVMPEDIVYTGCQLENEIVPSLVELKNYLYKKSVTNIKHIVITLSASHSRDLHKYIADKYADVVMIIFIVAEYLPNINMQFKNILPKIDEYNQLQRRQKKEPFQTKYFCPQLIEDDSWLEKTLTAICYKVPDWMSFPEFSVGLFENHDAEPSYHKFHNIVSTPYKPAILWGYRPDNSVTGSAVSYPRIDRQASVNTHCDIAAAPVTQQPPDSFCNQRLMP